MAQIKKSISKPDYVEVWQGDYGDYVIPKEFWGVNYRKNGLYDRRFTKQSSKLAEFREWIDRMEAGSKAAVRGDANG